MPTLNWIGKENVINHHNEIEYNVLACKENFGEQNSGNLLVKGDNLLALKALLPYYANQIKNSTTNEQRSYWQDVATEDLMNHLNSYNKIRSNTDSKL